MKIGTFKRILKEDFADEYKDLVDRLGTSINDAMTNLFQLADKKISIGDNFYGFTKTLTLEVDSTGAPTQTASFKLENNIVQPSGMLVIKVVNKTNSLVYPTSGVHVSWDLQNSSNQQASNLVIKNITGLPVNNKFEITMLILG